MSDVGASNHKIVIDVGYEDLMTDYVCVRVQGRGRVSVMCEGAGEGACQCDV